MATHFHPLRIKNITKETSDCIAVTFEIPHESDNDLWSFAAGQNITLKKTINGEELRRSYSICAAPHEKELKVAIKKVEGGKFSTYANEALKTGDIIEVMPPVGKFNARIANKSNPHYLAIAAGSGITPILSILKHTLRTQADSHFTLIYGSKNRHSIIFFEELEQLKNKYLQRFNFINILSREATESEIFHGRIQKEKLQTLGKLIDYKMMDAVYICGPESMIFDCSDFLANEGVDKTAIHYELFSAPGEGGKVKHTVEQVTQEAGPMSQVKINLDGRSFSFELGYNGQSVLDAALKQGADLPFACKGGVCCTCRAKLLEGQVRMDVNYALEPEEVEQGFILTCQSHPISEKIVIDFDVR